MKPHLQEAGFNADKIHTSWPVVDFKRFRCRGPNGADVMNTGAAIAKKNMNSFIDLGKSIPELRFRIYPIGYQSQDLINYNTLHGNPVEIHQTVEPNQMPREYKRHRWLVYTASKSVPTVGWPMAIAEAQASGVGVLIHNIRPDLAAYLDGAGHMFETLDEAARLIRSPFPEELRERGFQVAELSDLRHHTTQLLQLWST
jgi:glycosyltransferase involved in cell wall biosynthesis